MGLIFAAAAWLLWKVKWKKTSALMGLVSLWGLAGFLIVQFVFRYNLPVEMPTQRFMETGAGEVLDIGCGSGRTSAMIGMARPGVKIAALDNFSAQYIKGNGEELLRRNLRIAGITDSRVRVLAADMRKIPAADGEFDGVVSSYAIDHLRRAGIVQTLKEVNRVLKPNGEFLLMVIKADGWVKFVYAPLMTHMHWVTGGYWKGMLEDAGLKVVEQGSVPGTAYYVCRKL